MLDPLRTIFHPEHYHGANRRAPFFEGWYFKLISADARHKLALIPGIIKGEHGHSFIQVLNGASGQTAYHRFAEQDLHARRAPFAVELPGARFTLSGLELDVATPEGRLRGALRFGPAQPWPVSLLSPGIMGPFAWIPAMECYHGVLSFDHRLEGALELDGQAMDFGGGRGYIEKDWGQSFPQAWVWMQSNHFERPGVCLTASIARIPWLGAAFPGFIVGLWLNGRLYRFATYTGARTTRLAIHDQHVEWELVGGGRRLSIRAGRSQGGVLKGPDRAEMGKRVPETLSAEIDVRLTGRAGRVLFEGRGRHGGLEVVGDESLLVG